MKKAPSEIEKKTARYFELYPDRKVFYATSDGNVFANESLAKNHVNSSKGKKLEWFEVKNPKTPEEPKENQESIDKLVNDNKRDELNAMAVEKGMTEDEAKAFETKADLAEAILKLEA